MKSSCIVVSEFLKLKSNLSSFSVAENGFTTLVTNEWLDCLRDGKLIEVAADNYDEVKDAAEHLLCQTDEVLPSGWMRLDVVLLPRHDVTLMLESLEDADRGGKMSSESTYSQLLSNISNTIYKSTWHDTFNKYASTASPHTLLGRGKRRQTARYEDLIARIMVRLYSHQHPPCLHYTLDARGAVTKTSSHGSGRDEDGCGNVRRCLGVLSIPSLQHDCLLVVPETQHTVLDSIRFSPANLSSSSPVKPLFIVYQLLHLLHWLHSQGLWLGDITLQDLFITNDGWLSVRPRIFDKVLTKIGEKPLSNHEDSASVPPAAKHTSTSHERNDCSSGVGLSKLMTDWVEGRLSNYDYLMALNNLAGRRMGNPNCHPILPWVTDFTSDCGTTGWRDLAKSKYRLNKGDHQLDLTYQSHHYQPHHGTGCDGPSPHLHAPHHISDMLSDITYYVYKARRTPKSLLCKHVRSKWVPAEYPASIMRLQEWTPDECIPEFYTDHRVFESIHSDLPDLQLPDWAEHPADFIRRHRDMLEHDRVSHRLHHWIDVTFGYKLTGLAGVEAKNICLPLIDRHTNLSSQGVVQLFTDPHPARDTRYKYQLYQPPRIQPMHVNHLKEKSADSSLQSSTSSSSTKSLKSSLSTNILKSRFRSDTTLSLSSSSSSAISDIKAVNTVLQVRRINRLTSLVAFLEDIFYLQMFGEKLNDGKDSVDGSVSSK